MIEPTRAEISSSESTDKPGRAAIRPRVGALRRQGSRNGLLYSIDADAEQVRRTVRFEGTGWPATGLPMRSILVELMLAEAPYRRSASSAAPDVPGACSVSGRSTVLSERR
jgi:hypothetical protein